MKFLEAPRFCGHTICQEVSDEMGSQIYEITDTKKDPRFTENPLVVNDPNIRYYMAFILRSNSGENLGTLCILDTKPRKSSEQEKKII